MSKPLLLSIDNPSAHQESWGAYVLVSGWAYARSDVPVKVEGWVQTCFLDGILGRRVPLEVTTGTTREDVLRRIPEIPRPGRIGYRAQAMLPPRLLGARRLRIHLVFSTPDGVRLKKKVYVTLHRKPSEQRILERRAMLAALPSGLARPDFFILGAAKCGTTSLQHLLRRHPEIHMSDPKEPGFFSEDAPVVADREAYFALFPPQPGKKRYGEASHVYLSNPDVAARLHRLFPHARFVVILRDPVRRTQSLYQHMRRNGHEALPSLGRALEEEDRRHADPLFLTRCPQSFWNFMYERSSRYDEQLSRYFALFPREQFLVLALAEWKADPVRWQQEIFRFLGVRPDVVIEDQPLNVGDAYAPLPEELEARLRARFAGVRERVEGLIGRRFEHWDAS